MPKEFYERLVDYYDKVGQVLRGTARPASIFPNVADVGDSRERVYCEFLRQHVPSKCDVRLGGFLFQQDGSESSQIDLIVTTDTAARFDFFNRNGHGKSFSCVEGALAAFSVKSTLTKAQLFDALWNMASIPATQPIGKRVPPNFVITDYDDWPFKFIYASEGVETEKLKSYLSEFYEENPGIPVNRRPNLVHIAGSALAMRAKEGWGFSLDSKENIVPTGQYAFFKKFIDVQAIVWMLYYLHHAAGVSTQILYDDSPTLVGVSRVLIDRTEG